MNDITDVLEKQAEEIAAAGHNGWGNTMICAAAEIESLRAQVARLTVDAERQRDSRAMFVARIDRMHLDGEKWITLVGVLTLLNDCDMLATLSTKEQP